MRRPRRRHNYPAEPDLALRLTMAPRELDPAGGSALALRVRAKPSISHALLHLSGDGVSYHVAHDTLPPVVGLRLMGSLSGSGEPLEVGPLARSQGPDIAALRVLPDVDWKAGQYVMLIEDEWCYLREVVCVAEGIYRLQGLLRGQMDSLPASHAPETQAFVADRRWLIRIRDHLLRPGVTVHAKTQPVASTVLPLTSATVSKMTLPGGPDA